MISLLAAVLALPPELQEAVAIPKVGERSLRIVSPTLLDLFEVTTKAPDETGEVALRRKETFHVKIGSKEIAVTEISFKRRVLYAPLRPRDLRIGNHTYLRLAAPISEGSKVEAEGKTATASPSRFNPALHVSQVGYAPRGPKLAVVGEYLGSLGELDLKPGSSFTVVDSATQRPAFKGILTLRPERGWTTPVLPYQKVLQAEFSDLIKPGEYRLKVPGLGVSYPFRIDQGVAAAYARTYALGLYHQRCGGSNEMPFTRFVHAACHAAPAEVPGPENGSVAHQLAGESGNFKDNPRHTAPQLKSVDSSLYPYVRKGKIDVSGGHHDAGDYSKYTINSAALVHSIVFAADAFPGVSDLDNLGLPESGDGKSDVLAIAKWEADFLAKMQDEDGGFYFLVYPRGRAYENDVLPDHGDPQIVFPKTTAVTGTAVAALAQTASSPRFRQEYPETAAAYLRRAKLGWEFLERAWARYGKDGSYQKITHYGDAFMHDDEIAWAATEMYLATHDRKYHDLLLKSFDPADPSTRHWGWERLFDAYGNLIRSYAFAVQSGRVQTKELDPVFLQKCRTEIEIAAQEHIAWADENAYGTSFPTESKRFRVAGWYFSADRAFNIAVGEALRPLPGAKRAIWSNLAFEAGCNPNNVVFLTGLGWKRQHEIVHHYALNDDRSLPPSGIPLGSVAAGFMYLDPYKAQLGTLSFPPDGDASNPFPMYDRWGDSFNVTSEFTIPIQGRCLGVAAWLMARSGLKEQKWRSTTASILGVPEHVRVGQAFNVSFRTPGMAPGAQVVSEGLNETPSFGTLRTFRVPRPGKAWIEAEAQWPDGRRAFARKEFVVRP